MKKQNIIMFQSPIRGKIKFKIKNSKCKISERKALIIMLTAGPYTFCKAKYIT